MTVKRTMLGEATYTFEEIFKTPEEAVDKNNHGINPKFTLLDNTIQQVNIKPTDKETNIEWGKNNVQSTKNTTIKSSTGLKGSTDE